jgi:hypothetical protein
VTSVVAGPSEAFLGVLHRGPRALGRAASDFAGRVCGAVLGGRERGIYHAIGCWSLGWFVFD